MLKQQFSMSTFSSGDNPEAHIQRLLITVVNIGLVPSVTGSPLIKQSNKHFGPTML